MDSPPSEKRDTSISEKGFNEEVEVVDFGGDSTLPPPPQLTAEEERRLWRKVDLRLLPILSLMYLCSFLDRGISFFVMCSSDPEYLTIGIGNIGIILYIPPKRPSVM